MIKITIEEIEILVTAKIEDNLKQNMPKIKSMVEKIKQQFEKVDMSGFEKKTQYAVDKVNKKMNQLKGGNIDKTLQTQFQKAGASVEKYEKQLEQTKDKLKNVYAQMDERVENTWASVTPDGLDRNNPKVSSAIEPVVNSTLEKDSVYNKLITQEGQLNAKVEELSAKLQEAKQNYSNIGAQIQQAQSKQNIFTSMIDKLKSGMKNVKNQTNSFKNAFNKLPNITAKVNTKIKQMSKGTKTGLKHVLKYAGALFSLRGIYSVLSNSASAWLSSQNSQAKQLSANIDYMKYAMGSAFAPVIQYVTNLIYQLMKAIQSVVYALFKVNIFANASAKSYSNMADSASKASKETKSLAGFDEINNIGGSDNDTAGSGTTAPNMDLSTIDTSLVDKLSNLNFEELGKNLGEKLNSALSNIPWEGIKEKAKNIGTNIASLLNGFIGETNWENVGNTIAQGINTAIGFASSFITKFDFKEFGKSIAGTLNGFFKNTDWSKLSKTISEGIAGTFETITGFTSNIDWKSIVDGIVDFIKGIDYSKISTALFEMLGSACASLVNLGMTIGEKINDAIDSAKTYFQSKIEECGGNVVAGIFKGIGDALKNIGTWIVDNIFKPFINGFKNAFGIHSPSTEMETMGGYIVDGLKNGISGIWNKVKDIFNTLKTNIATKFSDTVTKIKEKFDIEKLKKHFNEAVSKIKEKFSSIHTWFKDKFSNVVTKIKEKFDKSTIKKHFDDVLAAIKNVFSNIPTWFKDKFSSAWTKVKDVFSKGGKVFTGIKDGILDSLKKVINGLIDGINKVIKIPFDGINKALDKIKGINILGKKPFSGLPTISVPQIPKLATGNVATEETLAIFGEYSNAKSNPEITAPQSIIYDTMKQALDDSALSSNKGNGSMPKQIVIKFGSTRVAYEIEELIRKAQRQNGTATVTI